MHHRVISNAAPYVRAIMLMQRFRVPRVVRRILSRWSNKCAVRRARTAYRIRELQSLTYLCRSCAR